MNEIDENAQNMINGHDHNVVHENEVAGGEGNGENGGGDHLGGQGNNHNGGQLMNEDEPVLLDPMNNFFDDIDHGMDGHLADDGNNVLLVVEGSGFEQVYDEWLHQQHNGNNGLVNGVGVNGDNHHGMMNPNEAAALLLEIENFLLGDFDQEMDVDMEGWEFQQVFNQWLQVLNGNDGNVEEDDQGWDFNGNANVQVDGVNGVMNGVDGVNGVNGIMNGVDGVNGVNGIMFNGVDGVNGIMNGVNGNAANACVNEDGNAPFDFDQVFNDEKIQQLIEFYEGLFGNEG